MFELRLEGQEAVEVSTADQAWSLIDQAFRGRDRLFWSFDGIASDMYEMSWRALCSDPESFVDYLGIEG